MKTNSIRHFNKPQSNRYCNRIKPDRFNVCMPILYASLNSAYFTAYNHEFQYWYNPNKGKEIDIRVYDTGYLTIAFNISKLGAENNINYSTLDNKILEYLKAETDKAVNVNGCCLVCWNEAVVNSLEINKDMPCRSHKQALKLIDFIMKSISFAPTKSQYEGFSIAQNKSTEIYAYLKNKQLKDKHFPASDFCLNTETVRLEIRLKKPKINNKPIKFMDLKRNPDIINYLWFRELSKKTSLTKEFVTKETLESIIESGAISNKVRNRLYTEIEKANELGVYAAKKTDKFFLNDTRKLRESISLIYNDLDFNVDVHKLLFSEFVVPVFSISEFLKEKNKPKLIEHKRPPLKIDSPYAHSPALTAIHRRC